MGLLLFESFALGTGRAQDRPTSGMPMDTTDARANAAADQAMSGRMMADVHMRMTPSRVKSVADSARAALRVSELRMAIEKYRDVHVAEADGYRIFLPNVPQPVYHFTNWRNGLNAVFGFDPARPTALLYKRKAGGGFELVGAMYTAPAQASLDELDRRVPLSVAHWHQHVVWCVPPRGAQQRWTETDGGMPRFGPKSPIATREACELVGGVFLPRIFGWMVHANVFAGDDPSVIWGG
ncbi:MAG: hypothetical protein ACHQX4_00760 [Gemmatimonadales bacterium]